MTTHLVRSFFSFSTSFCIAVLALTAVPTYTWGSCAPGTCIYSGFSICLTPFTGGSEEPVLLANKAGETIPPDYALVTEQLVPENCEDPDGKKTLTTVAIWTPTELLDQAEPYGLSISNELLKEMAEVDTFAAYLVGQRMYRESGLMPSPDMHHGGGVTTYTIMSISNIDEANGDSTKFKYEYSELPEGVQEYHSYHVNFGGVENPTISVESYLMVPGAASMQDHKRTTITLSSAPVYEELVALSDNYWAPVYEVEGFKVETLSPDTRRDHPIKDHQIDF